MNRDIERAWLSKEAAVPACLALAVLLVYLFTNPQLTTHYDYTSRIAEAMLSGRAGIDYEPPEWLNEMIPGEGRYYSAFPLGSVLTMVPVAVLKRAGLLGSMPGPPIAALTVAIGLLFGFGLSARYLDSTADRAWISLFPTLGTWMWANLAFGGAWQLALGFAFLGQLGALYYLLVERRPLLAGCFFALAFGNRTEVVLLAPVFLWLAMRGREGWRARAAIAARFVAVPAMLGAATMLYNYLRFASVFDFGYARIPGVLLEPWYEHGIFSIHAIPGNARAMLFEGLRRIDAFPWFLPTGFGGSIFISSPYLLFLFRPGARDRALKLAGWASILSLTLVLWCHGNTGGWQFSYRYAIELLPWAWLVILESGGGRVRRAEKILIAASILVNALGAWLFLRSEYFKLQGN